MKIKEVIAATGLTDRAIRLYIEHGLLLPDTKESYSGRRNIEFSPEDVEKLTAISTLRRAGFSIAQIKALDEGGDAATAALHEFMDEKRTARQRRRCMNSWMKSVLSMSLTEECLKCLMDLLLAARRQILKVLRRGWHQMLTETCRRKILKRAAGNG